MEKEEKILSGPGHIVFRHDRGNQGCWKENQIYMGVD
jgi:hypothetical protein